MWSILLLTTTWDTVMVAYIISMDLRQHRYKIKRKGIFASHHNIIMNTLLSAYLQILLVKIIINTKKTGPEKVFK